MAAHPILEEPQASQSGALIAGLAGPAASAASVTAQAEIAAPSRPERWLSIYPASAGYDLVEELDFLCARTIEPNIFFNPHFLAPAMPRLEDREVRLAVVRDGGGDRSRLRLLMPFSVEKPATPFGVAVLRAWSSPFGPLGTPLVDADDPAGVVDDFLAMLVQPHFKLPKVLVIPDMRLDGPCAAILCEAAARRKLALRTANEGMRAILQSPHSPDAYLRNTLRPHHFREFRRLKRRLSEEGKLEFLTLTTPAQVRHGLEAFLTLEAAGWKGRSRTAMAVDRYRAAFAREAVNQLAGQGMARVHLMRLNGRDLAALVVFQERSIAYTWKTAYDESYAAFSPGTLLMIEVTAGLLEDKSVATADSCAVPDHPVMSRLWSERMRLGTLVLGLQPGGEQVVRQAARQFEFYRTTRNAVRLMRNQLRALLRMR